MRSSLLSPHPARFQSARIYVLGTRRIFMWLLLASVASPILIELPRAAAQESVESTLKELLTQQSHAWNEAELDGFMATYWNSEQLTFSSGGRTTRGWQATYDRYDQRYRANNQMGTLRFSELETTVTGEASAFMLGRWELSQDGHVHGGNFTLIWRKMDGEWKIVHDHTSSDPTPAEDE